MALSEKLKSLIGETDKLDELLELMKEIDDLETIKASLEEQVERQSDDIANLRDINGRLALQITSPVKQEEETPEKTGDELIDELFNMKEE